MIGLGPALFRHILAKEHWTNYCKYISGARILQQHTISPGDLQCGHRLLCEFTEEFKWLYYQRCTERIHFIRQSIHLLTHLAPETIHIGPLSCYSQWTIETAIGNLGAEIRQDRNPYANLAQQGILCAQLNSLLAMFPQLNLSRNSNDSFPHGAKDLGDGYALLRACQRSAKSVEEAEANAITRYWHQNGWPNIDHWPQEVKRWARLRLPNGQTVRCTWYKSDASLTHGLHKMTCVRVCRISPHSDRWWLYSMCTTGKNQRNACNHQSRIFLPVMLRWQHIFSRSCDHIFPSRSRDPWVV